MKLSSLLQLGHKYKNSVIFSCSNFELVYEIAAELLVVCSLTEEIQDFAITFVNSLESCLENSPALLKDQKLRGTL